MKKIFIYLFAAAIVCGCAGRNGAESGPEQIVSDFNAAIVQGRFDEAASLCDTLLMEDYLKRCRSGWKRAARMNGKITSAAQSLLKDISTDVISIEKKGDKRIVSYTVGVPGSTPAKIRKAVLAKEEGEWKIKSVTAED